MRTTVDHFLTRPRTTIPFTHEPPDARTRLHATTRRRGRATIVCPRGAADAYTLLTWKHMLREAADTTDPPGPLVIDTDRLEFLSCRALGVLADEADRCRRHCIDLRLAGSQPAVARLVEAAGLHVRLPVFEEVDAAAPR
ncbi:anti-sigma factor antagonist [Nocardia mexicana]|uniref:Anti-sigma factor antagonist n=1 Tax=Nocardia mexicana TaxID=279262 RepID=A0A370GNG0_9NOCA|nr:anti-sigma factor antagonist [Nocardia mexicana]RDI44920.1 anti-anti-sigma factor [Nocardia mexicana]